MASFGTALNLTYCDVYRKVQLPRKPPQGIEGTGDNRDNGETFSLFPLSALFAMDPTMHPLFNEAAGITHDVIGAAIEVHKDKGQDYFTLLPPVQGPFFCNVGVQ